MNATEKDINLLDSDLFKTETYFEQDNLDAVRLGLKFMRATVDYIKAAKTPPSTLESFSPEELINELRRRLSYASKS